MDLSSLAFVHVYLVKETLSSKSIHEFIECQPQEGLCIISMESQRKLKLACHHNSTLSVHNVKRRGHWCRCTGECPTVEGCSLRYLRTWPFQLEASVQPLKGAGG